MRKDGGGEEREAQGNDARLERKRRDRDRDERPRTDERSRKERDDGDGDWRDRREHRRGQHRGGSRSRESRERGNPSSSYDSLASTDWKKRRIEEKEKQANTIFVGDLDPETTAEQLTGLFCKFGSVVRSKIKENHCYGFVTFEKRASAESAIAAGQKADGIELLNGKQVRVFLFES